MIWLMVHLRLQMAVFLHLMINTPIINGNQAAILGMHSIITRPIAIDQDTIEKSSNYVYCIKL